MRRIRRHIFRLCVALLLALCITSSVMLLRSLYIRDEITWAREGGSMFAFGTSNRNITIARIGPGWPEDRGLQWRSMPSTAWREVEQPAWPRSTFNPVYLPSGVRFQRGAGYFMRHGAGNPWMYPITSINRVTKIKRIAALREGAIKKIVVQSCCFTGNWKLVLSPACPVNGWYHFTIPSSTIMEEE